MKKNLLIISSLVLIFSLSLISCKTSQKVDYSQMNFDKKIKVAKKDTFSVEVVSNPSTGNRWRLIDMDKNKKVTFVKDEFVSNADPKLIGAAGKQIFYFVAKKKGQTAIEMGYARGKGTPSKKYAVLVDIE